MLSGHEALEGPARGGETWRCRERGAATKCHLPGELAWILSIPSLGCSHWAREACETSGGRGVTDIVLGTQSRFNTSEGLGLFGRAGE